MSHPAFQVQSPGLLTTIQDRGRPGFAAQGVAPGGAMDTWAASVANLIVGNTLGDAVLEMTLTGPALFALRDMTIALSGADLSPQVDNAPVPMGHTVHIRQGQTLRFGRRKSGARVYLAVPGGLDGPVVLGSRAPALQAGFGGRALRAGDILDTCLSDPTLAIGGRGLRPCDLPHYPGHQMLRVIVGPQDDLFTDEARAAFLSERYLVGPQSDRMGYRLEGKNLSLRAHAAETLRSEGVTFGAVQVAGGQPLLLMADCQTTGGYPVIGVVIRADLSQAAQCIPGTTLSFFSVSVEEAYTAWRSQQRFLRTLALAVGKSNWSLVSAVFRRRIKKMPAQGSVLLAWNLQKEMLCPRDASAAVSLLRLAGVKGRLPWIHVIINE